MNDAQPRTLGRYRLVSLLGEGGMGKVYRGFDSTLERNVAIKLLPAEVVGDASRLARFVQEARAASALNHPNVITVYDIGEERFDGESEPVRYIAMELVDGSTLRDLVGSSAIDLRKALKIAIQVAEGLTAAHAAGIIHRDLKPENIMVSAAGFAKVLDFGLAKLRITEEDPMGSSDSSRTLARPSEPGTVMGTVGYMSPEQAQGRTLDARSDVFSFGCVLYELASGRRAFQGDSSVDTLHKIIYSDPVPLRDIRNDVPPELARIVRKALTKDLDERYQSAKEIAIDLRGLLRDIDSNPSGFSLPAMAPAPPARRPWLLPAVVGLAALIAIAAIIAVLRRPHATASGAGAQEPRITRLTANGKVIEAGISPDGKFLAYVVSDQGQQTLLVRDLATGQALTLIAPKREAYWGLTFGPDSSSIFYAIKSQATPGGSIYQISTLGGEPRKIIDVVDSQPTFAPDGKQMAFLRAKFPTSDESAVMVANTDGSGVRLLAKVHAPEFFVPIFFAGASWSLDGKTIAASVIGSDQRARNATSYFSAESFRGSPARIVAIDVASGAMKTIVEHGYDLIAQVGWLPDQKGLVAIGLSNGARAYQVSYVPYPDGEPQPITRDLFDYRIVSLTADGKSLVTVASDITADIWIVRDGAPPRRISASKAEGIYGVASLPDGRIVATSIETGKLDLFLMNEDGSGRVRLTRDEYTNRSPAATHDGKTIVYLATTPKGSQICRINIDGTDRRVLAEVSTPTAMIDITPDDRTVVFEDSYPTLADGREGLFGLKRVSIDGGPVTPVGKAALGTPSISPDGLQIAAFRRDPTERFFSAVAPLAGTPVRNVAPLQGTSYSSVRWSPDGKSLVVNTIADDRSNLWAVPLDGSARRKLTSFDEHSVFAFAPLRDGKGWILSRGDLSRDAMMITGFRPSQ